MELKNIILSTLAELDEKIDEPKEPTQESFKLDESRQKSEKEDKEIQDDIAFIEEDLAKKDDDEIKFLENLRERVLVLFEGFQSPNNQKIEAKIDLTLNFLEYLLATIDERIERKK
jgi:hypothetical protein